jgi:predicted ribosome quality control (RQC) complex YloA/Tae2 family protein
VQNSYYLIRQLVPRLKESLVGASLADCFSQNKDELVIQFVDDKLEEFTIIAHLTPQFTCLAFPKEYHKARKNAATIFSPLKQLKVIDVEGFVNERAFVIHFESNFSLLFKLFGHQSNIVLYENNKVVSIFKSRLKNDYNIDLKSLNRPIDQTKEAIIAVLPQLKLVYPTLNRRTRDLLEEEINNLDANKAYEKVRDFINKLENPAAYYITKDDAQIKFNLLPSSNVVAQYTSPIEALNQFFRLFLKTGKYSTTRQSLLKEFEQKISKTKAYVAKTNRKKNDLGNKTSHREIADLIMASLHLIEPNSSSVELFNFYTNEQIAIKLNPRLSAQLNAEKYYNKAKNIEIEIKKLREAIASKELLLGKLKQSIKIVSRATEMSDLQDFLNKNKKKETTKSTPFKQFEIDGFTVLVGNNAKQNDLLTLKYAKKEDLFFHAKDVSGSHVILKQISGKSIPSSTLEKTAALAAYYSKRKTDSLCPVGYTPKKYVRKPKGSPAGLVLVEREKVLLVKPGLPQ